MPAVASSLDELLSELSRNLWKQRGHIELLQYRLEVQQLIFAAAKEQRLQIAVEEVEAAMDELRRSERTRDTVVRRCALTLGLAETASLAELRDHVDERWSALLAEHQTALLGMVNETESLAARNRELALKGAHDTRSLMDAITGSAPSTSYGPGLGRGLKAPTLIDRNV